MIEHVTDIGLFTIAGLLIASTITSAIHGATGVAGGILMAAIVASVVGVKPVLPVMSIALLISHVARAYLNLGDINRQAFLSIVVPAGFFITVTSLLYARMSSVWIALLLGCIIITSIPLRRWAKSRKITASRATLSGAGVAYGILSGVSIGPGLLLIPFLLGYGLKRQAFVATLAAIAICTNVLRLAVFGFTDLLGSEYLFLGVLIGLATIPGNWLGRIFLRKMTNEHHAAIVDSLTLLGALNFFWLAYNA